MRYSGIRLSPPQGRTAPSTREYGTEEWPRASSTLLRVESNVAPNESSGSITDRRATVSMKQPISDSVSGCVRPADGDPDRTPPQVDVGVRVTDRPAGDEVDHTFPGRNAQPFQPRKLADRLAAV